MVSLSICHTLFRLRAFCAIPDASETRHRHTICLFRSLLDDVASLCLQVVETRIANIILDTSLWSDMTQRQQEAVDSKIATLLLEAAKILFTKLLNLSTVLKAKLGKLPVGGGPRPL